MASSAGHSLPHEIDRKLIERMRRDVRKALDDSWAQIGACMDGSPRHVLTDAAAMASTGPCDGETNCPQLEDCHLYRVKPCAWMIV
jgi:hypothetical protein